MTRPAGAAFNLLIEGWRGVNHSFALVNQQQILEMLRLDRVRLFHRDLPFAFSHWTKATHESGLSVDDVALIEALADPADAPVDCVYRIASPFLPPVPPSSRPARRALTFITTELGLAASSFAAGGEDPLCYVHDGDAVVTTTAWTHARLTEYGFPPEKIHIVPLGVDPSVFRPTNRVERDIGRGNLGIAQDETVFLNVGAALWNKGIDVLLRAFAILRERGRHIRLILKDQREVYGVSVEQTLGAVGAEYPVLLQQETLAAISVIPSNISRAQLRLLYAMADCYASPYRAEGFNLPVIEAIACGTPAIVTRGGATDDFCDDRVAWRIGGRSGQHDQTAGFGKTPGRFIEPDLEALVDAMEQVVSGQRLPGFAEGCAGVVARFTWRRAACELVGLAGGPVGGVATSSGVAASVVRSITQAELLALTRTIRPQAMRRTAKMRIGNAYDGGYVLPAIAAECDAMLSIGIGSDVSFDLALAQRGAAILQFDHTVDGPPVMHPNFHFEKRGWGVSSQGSMLGFPDMLTRLAALGARRPLLKFDVEGAEYDLLDAIDADELAGFEIIVCEIHNLGRLGVRSFYDQVRRSLAKLFAHHVPVHLHGNNYAGMVMLEGIAIPDVLEISLLRRDLDLFGIAVEPIPGPLDRPNHPFAPDLCLTAFAA